MSRNEGDFEVLRPLAGNEEGSEGRRDRARSSVRQEQERLERKPRGAGEILDLGLQLLRDRFLTFVGISAALWVPVRVLQPFIGMQVWMTDGAFSPTLGMASWGFLMVSTVVVQTLVTAILALMVVAQIEGTTLSAAAAFRTAVSRMPVIIPLGIVTGVAAFVGTIMCFVPGILLTWKLCLAPSVCVLERGGVAESMRRSFELTRKSFLRWLAVYVVMGLLALAFTSIGAIGDQPGLRAQMLGWLSIPAPVFDWAVVALSSIFNGVATALAAVVITFFYLDCRVRRDGSDLRARLRDMQAAARERRTDVRELGAST